MERITYNREEGGFSVLIGGKKIYGFKQKKWMNNLKEFNGGLKVAGHPDRWLQTQREYEGYVE